MVWTYENIVVCIAAVLYASVGLGYFMKGNIAWCIVWCSYSAANFGLILAANK